MSQEIFNRIEKKFLIDEAQHNAMTEAIEKYMFKDEYGDNASYLISNIYYDTQDDFLIKRSISKPHFKEKLRLRGYGRLNMESLVYLELKKKINGIVNKRRSPIRLCEAYHFIHTGEMPAFKAYHNQIVLREIQFFLKRYDVKAKTYLAYERRAYKLEHFRVTVDTNIISRDYDLRLEYGLYGEALLTNGYFVMEAKTQYGLPLWFVDQLSHLKIYNRSFSKIGKDFIRKHQTREERGIKSCSIPYSVIHQQQPLHL